MGNMCISDSGVVETSATLKEAKSSQTAEQAAADSPNATTTPPITGEISNKVALGAGCYWGTEKFIKKNFQQKFPNSIKVGTVGFMSPEEKPRIKNPNYQQVCTGASGHVEVLYVEIIEPERHFEELIRFFFTFHDPTTLNRQGNDSGFQYASYIFCGDDKQEEIARRVKAELQTLMDQKKVTKFSQKLVSTKIGPLREFTPAHKGHQEYLEKNPNGYCNHYIRIKQWPK